MKKALVLVAVAAMFAAAPVFAEITVSGDFKATMTETITGGTGTYSEAYLDTTAAVPDNTTFYGAMEQNADNDISFGIDSNVGKFSSIAIGVNAEAGGNVTLDEMSLTQDLTGALGVKGPITLSYTIGDSGFGAYQYDDTLDAVQLLQGDELDLNFEIGVMDMVTFDLGFVPSSYFNGNGAEFGIGAHGVFGPASVGVTFCYTDKYMKNYKTEVVTDPVTKAVTSITYDVYVPDELASTGLEFNSVWDFSPLTVTEVFQVYNLNNDDKAGTHIGDYTRAELALDMGVTLGLETTLDKVGSAKMDLSPEFDAAYAISDSANVDGYFQILSTVGTISDNLEFGVGADVTLDGVKYRVDYVGDTGANFTSAISLAVSGSF